MAPLRGLLTSPTALLVPSAAPRRQRRWLTWWDQALGLPPLLPPGREDGTALEQPLAVQAQPRVVALKQQSL